MSNLPVVESDLALRQHLLDLGQLTASALKLDEGQFSEFFHDIINCGKPLRIEQFYTRHGYLKRFGYCPTHRIKVCYCGWARGHHFEYSKYYVRRRKTTSQAVSSNSGAAKGDSSVRRVAIFG